jgi:hypothetical protein
MANKENIRKWVEALRSGEYRQGKGHLTVLDSEEQERSYCCLGVACEISGVTDPVEVVDSPNTGDPILSWSGEFAYSPTDDEENSRFFPPREVLDWLGLEAYNPPLTFVSDTGSQSICAAEANDTFGKSFEEIADAIERTYLDAA